MKKKTVYLISFSEGCNHTHFVKVGISSKFNARFGQLQSSSPYCLKKLFHEDFNNAEIVESMVLNEFKSYRVRGEWFMVFKPKDHDVDCSQTMDKDQFDAILIDYLKSLLKNGY